MEKSKYEYTSKIEKLALLSKKKLSPPLNISAKFSGTGGSNYHFNLGINNFFADCSSLAPKKQPIIKKVTKTDIFKAKGYSFLLASITIPKIARPNLQSSKSITIEGIYLLL